MQSLRYSTLCFCLVFAVCGCGKAEKDVKAISGTVTLGGTPLEKGSINFVPKDGKAATEGAKIENGKYTANIPFGDKRVEIRAPKVTGQRAAYEGDPNSPKIDIVTELVPPRYNAQSELSFTVDAKSGKADFALELPKE